MAWAVGVDQTAGEVELRRKPRFARPLSLHSAAFTPASAVTTGRHEAYGRERASRTHLSPGDHHNSRSKTSCEAEVEALIARPEGQMFDPLARIR